MFGIGFLELIVLLVVGTLVMGTPILILVLLFVVGKNNNTGSSNEDLMAQLREENQQLREELEATRKSR